LRLSAGSVTDLTRQTRPPWSSGSGAATGTPTSRRSRWRSTDSWKRGSGATRTSTSGAIAAGA